MKRGIVIVDHGSRRAQSNEMLECLTGMFAKRFAEKYDIVEPAHMEIAEPSIGTAYERCVSRGAELIVVCPFFLGPGKHWTEDIPRLTAEAGARFPATQYHVAPTLGIDDLILDLIDKRASGCDSNNYDCELCRGTLRAGRAAAESR
jgi:sirohydrochlorin ferrochelatase